ncbi:hypothetical protein IWZ01DRAFT_509852 [Phyllosticta capitalensis]
MASSSSTDGNIHFSGAYAVAEWQSSQHVLHLVHPDPSCNISCAIRLDVGSKCASFKLRIPVALKAQRTKTSVFLSIPPEQILSLHSEHGPVPDIVRGKLNTHVTSLSFSLSKAPLVITPSIPLTPKNKKSGEVLEGLQSLASSTAFTIYIPSRYISRHGLDVLCRLAIGTDLKTHPKEASLASLYGGSGARCFPGDEFRFAAPADNTAPTAENKAADNYPPADSPPSYDELAPTPPPFPEKEKESHVETETPSKRRRIEESNSPNDAPSFDEARIQDIFKTLFEQRESSLRAEITLQTQKALDAQIQALETRLTANITSRLDAWVAEVREELRSEMAAINARVQELTSDLEGLDERVEGLSDEVLDEAESTMEIKLDDRIMDIKDEMSEYVREELRNTEDRIKADLSGASISLQFD